MGGLSHAVSTLDLINHFAVVHAYEKKGEKLKSFHQITVWISADFSFRIEEKREEMMANRKWTKNYIYQWLVSWMMFLSQ